MLFHIMHLLMRWTLYFHILPLKELRERSRGTTKRRFYPENILMLLHRGLYWPIFVATHEYYNLIILYGLIFCAWLDLQPNRYNLIHIDLTRHEYRHMISRGTCYDPRCQLNKSSDKYILSDTYRVKHTIMNIQKRNVLILLRIRKNVSYWKMLHMFVWSNMSSNTDLLNLVKYFFQYLSDYLDVVK